jgi:tRNA(Ile)-lysidine synthase
VTRAAAELEAAVRGTGLLAPGRPVLVMYSGGRDSTCLLDLAVRICGAADVAALHVNYGLRPGAGLDERHCEAVCEAAAVPLSIERPAGPEGSRNLQAWARVVRYAAARRVAGGADVAAGHTASDQLETILYRLISSPSRRALLGMQDRSGQLIRPLLTLNRQETGVYCRERGLPYRDDPTNDAPTYIRNRIRNELIPLINALHPGAEANVMALADILRDEQEVLHGEVLAAIAARCSVPLSELRQWPPGFSRLAMQHLADQAIGQPAAGVSRRAADILAMNGDAKLDLPNGIRAVTTGGDLRFERTPPLQR